jgi:hypothetical protein
MEIEKWLERRDSLRYALSATQDKLLVFDKK